MLENTQVALVEVEEQLADFILSREQENEQKVEEIKQVIGELDSLQQEFDLESVTRKLEVACVDVDQQDERDDFQVFDNPLYEVGAEATYDNSLFVLENVSLW